MSKSSLRRHKRLECGVEPKYQCYLFLFPCNHCHKGFRYKHNLTHHQRYKCNKPPQFCCMFCEKRFTSKGYLKIHVSQKHTQCEKCLKIYKYKQNLKIHQKTNCTRRASFICAVCGRRFSSQGFLRRHMASTSCASRGGVEKLVD
ncbi:zinc finger protein 814-like [Cylas formicarius]|uniref:zinc finger protein 814-like n=1 Tax=Cylas formicarius TaxID=197179 RepID=UPI002958A54E|nr:zinc finger protein 814-like [Cylas formicarius]